MQIEAIRAHPGSAHVTGLWHSQKSFLLHERNNNSSPAPPRPGTRDGLVRGAPELDKVPPSPPPPGAFQSPRRRTFPRKSLPFFHGDTNSAGISPHRLLGWERRRDGEGEHRWERLESLFLHQVRKSAPSRASLRFGTDARADVLC